MGVFSEYEYQQVGSDGVIRDMKKVTIERDGRYYTSSVPSGFDSKRPIVQEMIINSHGFEERQKEFEEKQKRFEKSFIKLPTIDYVISEDD